MFILINKILFNISLKLYIFIFLFVIYKIILLFKFHKNIYYDLTLNIIQTNMHLSDFRMIISNRDIHKNI